jgi:hypothetical protein
MIEHDDMHGQLIMATRQVAMGRRMVVRQRERLARLKAIGEGTLDHEHTLRVLEETLLALEEHARFLSKRARNDS